MINYSNKSNVFLFQMSYGPYLWVYNKQKGGMPFALFKEKLKFNSKKHAKTQNEL